MKKTIGIALLLGWSLLTPARAAEIETLYPYARIAMPELQIGVGTRIPALGGAGAAASGSEESLYWNPAGLSRLPAMRVEFVHNSWIQGVGQETMTWASPLTNTMDLALGFNYYNLGTIEKTGINTAGWMEEYKQTLYLGMMGASAGMAFTLESGLALGVSVHGYSENLGETQQMAIFTNAGLQMTPLEALTIGAVLENVGAGIKKYSLPMGLRLGGAYNFAFSDAHKVLAALDGEMLLANLAASQTHFGIEYGYDGFIFVRAGMQLSGNPQSAGLNGVTAGLGFVLGSWDFGYTFSPQGELGTSHRVSLGVNLDKLLQGDPEAKANKSKKARKVRTPQVFAGREAAPARYGSAPGTGISTGEAAMRSLLKSGIEVSVDIASSGEAGQEQAEVHFRVKRTAAARIKNWKLILKDAKAKGIQTLQETELPKTIIWDGRDAKGQAVTDLEEVQFEIVLTDVNDQEEKFQNTLRQMMEQPAFEEDTQSPETEAGGDKQDIVLFQPMSFGPILFDRDRAEIRPEGAKVIAQAADFILSHPNTKVFIEGFCDGVEEADKKQMLSKARAEAVVRYLSAYHKIPLSRILQRGRGDDKPVANNLNPDERQKNRRVMITIREKKRIPIKE